VTTGKKPLTRELESESDPAGGRRLAHENHEALRALQTTGAPVAAAPLLGHPRALDPPALGQPPVTDHAAPGHDLELRRQGRAVPALIPGHDHQQSGRPLPGDLSTVPVSSATSAVMSASYSGATKSATLSIKKPRR